MSRTDSGLTVSQVRGLASRKTDADARRPTPEPTLPGALSACMGFFSDYRLQTGLH